MAESKRRLSKSETRDSDILRATGTNSIITIDNDYFAREARENMAERGESVEVVEDINWPPELKAEYARMKRLERLEGLRTNRKDRNTDEGEETYDGGDIDLTGDPEQDKWLRGDWWVMERVVEM